MLKRKPTRIELKPEDMEEYEQVRRSRQILNSAGTNNEQQQPRGGGVTPDAGPIITPDRRTVHQRVGYQPSSPVGATDATNQRQQR